MNHAKLTFAILIAICILATSLLYAIWPFYQTRTHQLKSSKIPAITIPYISSQPQDLDIQLNSYILNPIHNSHPSIDPRLNSQLLPHPKDLYLVQYKTNATQSNAAIATFETNTQLMQLSQDEIRQLVKNPQINFITNYHPAYKFPTDLIQNLNETPPTPLTITVTTNPNTSLDTTTNEILSISPDIEILEEQNLPGSQTLTLEIPSNYLIQLAQLTSIIWIQSLSG